MVEYKKGEDWSPSKKPDSDEVKISQSNIRWVLVLFLVVASLYFVFILALALTGSHLDYVSWVEYTGQFGDSFGLLTAVASGLAVYFVYETLQAQKEELLEARKEMQLTRHAQQEFHKSQLLQMVEERKTMDIKGMEDSFYKLLDFHRRNVELLSYNVDGKDYKSGQALAKVVEVIWAEFYEHIYDEKLPEGSSFNKLELYNQSLKVSGEKRLKAWKAFYKQINSHAKGMSMYSRHVQVIARFLNTNRGAFGGKFDLLYEVFCSSLRDSEVFILLYFMLLEEMSGYWMLSSLGFFDSLEYEGLPFTIDDFISFKSLSKSELSNFIDNAEFEDFTL